MPLGELQEDLCLCEGVSLSPMRLIVPRSEQQLVSAEAGLQPSEVAMFSRIEGIMMMDGAADHQDHADHAK